jgi:hypothetical protein
MRNVSAVTTFSTSSLREEALSEMPGETFSDWPRYFSFWSAFRLALPLDPSYPRVFFLTLVLSSGEYEYQTHQHGSGPSPPDDVCKRTPTFSLLTRNLRRRAPEGIE